MLLVKSSRLSSIPINENDSKIKLEIRKRQMNNKMNDRIELDK